MLIVQGDLYSSRIWCQKEVLWAKKHNRPIVGLNVANQMEERRFPYAGNIPVFEWKQDNCDRCKRTILFQALLRLLQEMLKLTVNRAKLDHVLQRTTNPTEIYGLEKYPELADLKPALLTGKTKIVYPDPPLSTDEIELLTEHVSKPIYSFSQAIANEI